MGSPLAATLVNLFVGYHEHICMEDFEGQKSPFYKRRVVFSRFSKIVNKLQYSMNVLTNTTQI